MQRSLIVRSCTMIAALLASQGASLGALSQAVIVSPAGFVQAASFSVTGGNSIIPGGDLATIATPQDFHEHAFSGVSSATESASFSSALVSNGATGHVGMGFLHMQANNHSKDTTSFALGATNGGWKDTFLITHPTLTGSGTLVFKIRGNGTLHAAGLTGSTFLISTGYKDNVELTSNPLFNPGTADPVSGSNQRARWAIATFGVPPTDSRIVSNSVVTMAVPFTFGQSFTLGVYAWAGAGQRSSGGFGGTFSSADIDFTLEWDGITGVYVGGSPVSGVTINSGTGVNWGAPVPACPGDADGDHTIGLSDVASIINCWSQPATCNPGADLDHDGTIGLGDIAAVISHWSVTCP